MIEISLVDLMWKRNIYRKRERAVVEKEKEEEDPQNIHSGPCPLNIGATLPDPLAERYPSLFPSL